MDPPIVHSSPVPLLHSSSASCSGDKLVANCPTLTVMCGISIMCLIDTGSMVSTITEEIFHRHLQPLGSTMHLNIPFLRITAANGLEIPYVGYVEVDLNLDGIVLPQMGFLVVKDPVDMEYQKQKHEVPGILGMNVLARLVDCLSDPLLPDSSSLHFLKSILSLRIEAKSEKREIVTMVKSHCQSVFIPPETSVTVMAKAQQNFPFKLAVVEPLRNTDHFPVGFLVASTLVHVGKSFPVRIDNISKSGFTLRPQTRLGVLRAVEGIETDSEITFTVTSSEKKG